MNQKEMKLKGYYGNWNDCLNYDVLDYCDYMI
jgi:hypothetical protein